MGEIPEEALADFIQTRDAIIELIQSEIDGLINSGQEQYPEIAVNHHRFIIARNQRIALIENEILSIARAQVKNILEYGKRRNSEEPFILNPLNHE